jgi:hypothetical protein
VPLGPGEVLLHNSGSSTRRTVLVSWLGASTCSLYVAAAKSAEWLSAGPELLSPTWTAFFGGVAAITLLLARSTSRSCVRHAVLTSDGAHLRVYPYGTFGLGAGKPVSIPIPLLSLNTEFTEKKKDTEGLHVRVKDSRANLIFDKPEGLGLPRVAGPGLEVDEDGVRSIKATAAVAGMPALPVADALGLMDKRARSDFRRYAALLHVLDGNVVNPSAVASLDFPVDKMRGALRARDDRGAKSLWKTAKDDKGREYWYHETTWQTQWFPPMAAGAAGGKE